MMFRNKQRLIFPALFFGCIMPLMQLTRNGRLDQIRTVDFLLIFISGFALGAVVSRLVAMKRDQAK